MKLLSMIFLSNLLTIVASANPIMTYGGECGKYKPSLRATGASNASMELAYEDALRLAKRSCKNEVCNNIPGSGISASCGIHDSQETDGTYYVTADYLCTCAF